jgi:large subunit ribosomal protein L32
MVKNKPLVRIVGNTYIRIVGASKDEAATAFSRVKKIWSERGLLLLFSTHEEKNDWYHITFAPNRLGQERIAVFMAKIRDDVVRFLEN